MGIKHLGSEDSSLYLYVLLSSSLLAYFFLFVDFVRVKKIKKSALVFILIPFFVFAAYLVGGSFNEFANKTIALYFLIVVPSMLAGYVITRDNQTNDLVKGFLIVSVLIFLGLIRSFSELLSSSVIDLLTVFGGGQYQALSYFAAFGYSTFLAYFFFYTKYKFNSILFPAISVLTIFIVGIILSGGRGGLIVVFVVSIIFILKKFGVKKFIVTTGIAILLLILFYQFILLSEFENKDRILQSFERLFSFISNDGIDMSQTSNREEFYARSISFISDSLLFGYGIFGYINYTGEFYSHNIILDILLHGGIIYLILWLCFFSYFFFKSFIILKYRAKEILFLVPTICSFSLLLFSGTYLQEGMFWFSISFVYNYKLYK